MSPLLLSVNAADLRLSDRLRAWAPPRWFQVWILHVRPPDVFSFPSGHTMNAFAIATVLAVRFPAWSPALFLLAAGIGTSRVVLGLHFASDVWVGAALGTLIGWVSSGVCP